MGELKRLTDISLAENEDESSPGRESAEMTPVDHSPSLSGETTRNVSFDRVAKAQHEQSPLLSPAGSGHEEEEAMINDRTVLEEDERYDAYHETKSLWYMILLTVSIGGLQLAWSVELSNGTPYLLSLGLSKSLMALVWIAGPLTGALVQPYVGMLSDRCRSPWGKRKPFMVGGGLATIISLLALSWAREIVGGFLGLFGANPESQGVKTSIIVFAVLWVYCLDFAINTVQAAIRAFILDCAPSHQQESANSMASRAVGVGNIIGYVAGYLDLPKYVWFFGNTQFKVLCVIASLALGSTISLSISTIKERDPRLEPPISIGKAGIISFFKQVFSSIKRLPPQTRKVCEVEFMAWIGFFPQLFYSSSYIGDIYVQPYLLENPNMTPAEIDRLYEKATRVGTFALLIYAITSLSTNVLLPFVIAPTYDSQGQPKSSTVSPKSNTTLTSKFLNKLIIPWLTLRRAWLISHLIFAGCMFSTLVVRSIGGATALIGIIGISWAMTLWAPFAIISAEVSKRDALRRSRQSVDGPQDDEDQAGVILGIHNMSVAAPQILATIGSSIVFKFLQKPRGVPGDRSFSVVLAAGGLSTLVAAYLTSRIKDEVELADEVVEEGRSRDARPLVRSRSFGEMEY
ncbi:hypothetical protein B7494_g5796 [Chlorociboria aeruginascens]|nr:hypothetical protein B7494_g5796 [Chlorociboria aeruginascens]